MLTLYPAIDLKDGACVRLRRGDMAQAMVYSDDPAAQARAWEVAGFAWLHVVDLNGAFAGRSVNGEAVAAILGVARVPVQLGGGIRDRAAVERWLEAGVRRVVLGSAAVSNPDLVREACRAHPGRVAVGLDARDGMVATEGWASTSRVSALELALRFEDAGAAAVIYTDIGRDGMLRGPEPGSDRGARGAAQDAGDRERGRGRRGGPRRAAPGGRGAAGGDDRGGDRGPCAV